ncbi:MAG: Tritrans,polycis-undecaprenyl-diphosphate synthase (GGDP specific) [Methanonatronarchaeales archaeon]|nr:Tritrans,polycis-undecaprenyl-diphosphate synthase (GGDP specific) [Methanonatronarchaeales archaeon]
MKVPRHVAAIQDGNRRYAERRGELPYKGHQKGVETTRAFLRWCSDAGVEEVTIYALSTENLYRDGEELAALFSLLEEEFRRAALDEEVHQRGMRIQCIGARDLLPESLLDAIRLAEGETAGNGERLLNVAVGYGGRLDLLQAAESLASDLDGDLTAAEAERELESRLGSGGLPVSDVDLLIRTGGEKRISNFLPWQAAGSRCAAYFSEKMWPEFTREEFEEALRVYSREAVGPDGRRALATEAPAPLIELPYRLGHGTPRQLVHEEVLGVGRSPQGRVGKAPLPRHHHGVDLTSTGLED